MQFKKYTLTVAVGCTDADGCKYTSPIIVQLSSLGVSFKRLTAKLDSKKFAFQICRHLLKMIIIDWTYKRVKSPYRCGHVIR